MKKIKVMVLTLVVMLTMGLAMVAEAANPDSREVMHCLYGAWSPYEANYEVVINVNYFEGRMYRLKQAYINDSFIYAYIDVSGSPVTVKAWKSDNRGPVYDVMMFWDSRKPEPDYGYEDVYYRKY